ncbi:MAG: hypothetical protein L3J93_03830 [Thermoplasmata archaeon]|nr:hypothetical protein [Thermoplasmata archaeon]
MRMESGLSELNRTTVQVLGEEIRTGPHVQARGGAGPYGKCPTCQKVHGTHLVRYLSISSARASEAPGAAERLVASKYYPPVVPVLATEANREGVIAGRWSVAVE